MYKKIGVAVAFSPRCEAIIGESARLQKLFDASLVLIHIGEVKPDEKTYLEELVQAADVNIEKVKFVWEMGNAANQILSVSKKEKIDLLVAGALQRETIVKFYFGSIARKLIRNSECSILMLINPAVPSKPLKRIVINGTEGISNVNIITRGITFAKMEKATQVHIFKGIKLFGLSMALSGEEESEQQQEETRREIVGQEIEEINKILSDIDTKGLKVNVKVASGKSGFELRKFTERVKADLLIVSSPTHKLNFFDRLFPHYMELIMEDLPSNLLIDKS
ncbi:MAG: universal stress protein [Cyclobacteriaceae bacterium]|nr:universal stress protein [Cyclobacteriaceae bacterium]